MNVKREDDAPVAKPSSPREDHMIRNLFSQLVGQRADVSTDFLIRIMQNQLDLTLLQLRFSRAANVVFWNKNGIVVTPAFTLNGYARKMLKATMKRSPPRYKEPRIGSSRYAVERASSSSFTHCRP